MQYQLLTQFTPFNEGEIIEGTDLRFGSEVESQNQPHIDHLIEANILQPIEDKPHNSHKYGV